MEEKEITRHNQKELVCGLVKKLKSLGTQRNIDGMKRFGIRPKAELLGVSMPELRKIGKELKKEFKDNHKLALDLWDTKIHEAKILAGLIADSKQLTSAQMEKWVKEFDSWDVCDQVCMNLFNKSELANKKIFEWAKRKEEFVKRTSFALIAALSVHDKKMTNKNFLKFFPLIKEACIDERNFVKKAVNWALRQIGKRNMKLNIQAIKLAKEIQKIDSKVAKWVASNALTELTNKKIIERISAKGGPVLRREKRTA